MTTAIDRFVEHLQRLHERDRGASARLRRSIGFAPGTYAPAMPYVEPFAAGDETRAAMRQAMYVGAGLFALHPKHRTGASLAAGVAAVMRNRDSPSIERRFIALLSADPDTVPEHLRHVTSLLAADDVAVDYVQLIQDLARWLDSWTEDARDRVRERWARDFYRPPADRTDTRSAVPTPQEDAS